MKKIVFLLFFIPIGIVYAQEDIDRGMVCIFIQKKDYAMKCLFQTTDHDSVTINKAIHAFDDLFSLPLPEEYFKYFYHNYADLLAQRGRLNEAVFFYDKAYMEYKTEPISWFSIPYRKKYFQSDTILYNKKLEQYKNFTPYTTSELERIYKVKEIFNIDQYARLYYAAHPDNKEILQFSDSVVMDKILSLLKEYPNVKDPFQSDPWAHWVISRHIFTAYPVFWLDNFEPQNKINVLNGLAPSQTYAFMYDRCIYQAYKQESYYGEWVAEEHSAGLDTVVIDQRRAKIFLPSLKEKKTNKNVVQPIYE